MPLKMAKQQENHLKGPNETRQKTNSVHKAFRNCPSWGLPLGPSDVIKRGKENNQLYVQGLNTMHAICLEIFGS